MKKLIALFTVLLIVTGAAFAQIPDGLTIGGWSRSDFAVVQGQFWENGDNVFRTGVGSGWGPAYMGLVFTFVEAEGRIGGKAEIGWGSDSFQQGDALYAWAKPFANSDILEISIGSFNQEEFRGPGTDGNFNDWIGSPGASGDPVFKRIDPRGGVLFLSRPVEGLSVYASVDPGWFTMAGITPLRAYDFDSTNPTASPANKRGDSPEANDVYKRIQAGFAYDIAGIGLARVQYVGNTGNPDVVNPFIVANEITYTSIAINAPRIEAAFQVKALEGLVLDIGGKIPIPVKENNTAAGDLTVQDNFQLNAAGNFKAGDFGVQFGVYSGFGGSVVSDRANSERSNFAPYFNLTVGPNFYLAGLDSTVGVDLGFKIAGEGDQPGSEKSTDFGFGAWISKDLGKGLIKTGVAYVFPTYKDNKANTVAYLSWPIILELSY